MDGKFFSESTKEVIIDVLDGLKDFGIYEVVERPIYRIVLGQVDKYADKVVPDELDEKINLAAQLAINGDYEKSAEQVGEIIDILVNIEKIDDNIEKMIFVDGLKFVVRQILLYVEKKKG